MTNRSFAVSPLVDFGANVQDVEFCARCEAAIAGDGFVRECEANAPYQPSIYCSQECCDAADEDAFESAYSVQP